MRRKINLVILSFALLSSVNAQGYLPNATYTGDTGNRIGHSNSTPSDCTGGKMNSPSEIIQVGSNVLIAGMAGTDLGDFFIHKKNANTGANIQMLFVHVNDFLNLPLGSGASFIKGMKYDPVLDRIYVYGSTSLSGYSGFILCYNQTTMIPDNSFDFDGLQMLYSGDIMADLVVLNDSRIVTLINTSNSFKIVEISTTGNWIANLLVNDASKSFSARRIKTYPSKPNRFYVVGKILSNSINTPGIWGIDRIPNKFYPTQFQLIATNNQISSTEGVGEFEDLCFPMNNSTGICDIVVVGNSSVGTVNTGWTSQSSGIYIKYKGSLSTSPFNLIIENSFKNQSSLPGVGIATNIPSPNKAYFTRCAVVGSMILVIGSDGVDDNATVGLINSTGTNYSRMYIAPYSGANRVHFPRGFYLNSGGQVFLSGCDTEFGLTSIKLDPVQ